MTRNPPSAPIPVAALNWAMIELLRDNELAGMPRHSVRHACEALAKILLRDQRANVSAAELMRHHRENEASRKRAVLAGYFMTVEGTLAEARERREQCGWHTSPVVLLGLSA